MLGQGRPAAVEMHAMRVDHQTDGRIALSAQTNRAQERILDPHQRHAAPRRHRLTAPRVG
jgi:hypothetical protein